MNLPTYEELYPYTLQSLSDGLPKAIKEIREEVANDLKLTQEQINFRLESGIIQYNNRIAWSLSYLKQAGAVTSPNRGTYRITDVGYKLLKLDFIDNSKLMQFESFRKFKNKSYEAKGTEDINSEEETPEEAIISKVELIDAELREDILAKILENSPFYFEKIVLKLLNAMGYGDGSLLTTKSGDGGIDGIINEDPLGFHNIYVQAKRWDPNSSVGRPEIQKFKGAMDDKYEGFKSRCFYYYS